MLPDDVRPVLLSLPPGGRSDVAARCKDWLRGCYRLAQQSPDPSTKNAAILINDVGPVCGAYNTFPRGMAVTPERLADRAEKLARVQHAETGAIFAAARQGIATQGLLMVCTWSACQSCAVAIIQAGITTLLRHVAGPNHESWRASVAQGDAYLRECGVEILEYAGHLGDCTAWRGGTYWEP